MTARLFAPLTLLLIGLVAVCVGCAPAGTTAKPGKALAEQRPQEWPKGLQHIAPQLAMGADGRVNLIWLSLTIGEPKFDFFFSRSDDNGLTWLPEPISLQQEKLRPGGSVRIFADRSGALYAFYALGLRTPRRDVLSFRSPDGGVTWEGPSVIKSANTVHASTFLLDEASETLYAIIPVGGTEFDWKLELFRSSDKGAHWVQLPTLDYAEGRTRTGLRDFHVLTGDQGRLHALWSEAATSVDLQAIYYNRLSPADGGAWLPKPIQVTEGGKTFMGAQNPRMTVGREGRIFAVWEQFWKPPSGRFEGTFPQKIYVSRTLDNGATWLTPTRLSSDGPTPLLSAGGTIATDGGDHAYVAWIEGDSNRPGRLKFARSADAGTTWMAPSEPFYAADRGSYLTTPLYLKADAEGHVYLLWQQLEGERWSLLFNRSTDHGQTWLPKPYQIARTRQYSRAAHSLAFQAGGPRLFVAWDGGSDANSDIFVIRSMDFGATWLDKDIRVSRR